MKKYKELSTEENEYFTDYAYHYDDIHQTDTLLSFYKELEFELIYPCFITMEHDHSDMGYFMEVDSQDELFKVIGRLDLSRTEEISCNIKFNGSEGILNVSPMYDFASILDLIRIERLLKYENIFK